jgi:hypothetical protein
MATGLVTRQAPAIFGETLTEGYLSMPVIMTAVAVGPLALRSTLDFEGYTLQRGELNPGVYGEGYIDRRHPHTLVHEMMISAMSPSAYRWRASLSVGKGFTPYGTDDPMMRPFEKFPVNHHHAQIIERVQVVGAVSIGPPNHRVSVEQAWFNGDEPVGPFTGPQWRRVGDSHATRVTLTPIRDLELQGSQAFVRSPGIIQGGAFDHRQSSVSVRFNRFRDAAHDAHAVNGTMTMEPPGMAMDVPREYVLMELARTDEGTGARRAFRYTSMLAEALVQRKRWGVAARIERTERPENERLLDPFRTANGHIDFQIIGVTRWDVATLHVDAPTQSVLGRAASRHPRVWLPMLTPFVEADASRARAMRTPAVFVPRDVYGANTLWTLTVGARISGGAMRSRMGRYGVMDGAQ